MKKMLTFAITGLLAVSLLGGCGGGNSAAPDGGPENSPAAEAVPVDQMKTMGDAFTYESSQSAFSEGEYVYVFEADGVYYRAVAEMPADVSAAVWEIDFFDEARDEKIHALVAPLEISRLENLSEQILPQEELDGWVGKTGQDLLDDGWTNWGYNLESMEFWMYHGPFSYTVVFDYDGPQMENTDEFDWEEAVKPLTIQSVTFDSLGDAANLDEGAENPG